MIPRRLVRTVPSATDDEIEQFWTRAVELHPAWHHVTLRDPLDPIDFPVTSPHWDRCLTGAQRAGLIRLETIWWHGGVYIDSDLELYRPLDPLLQLDCWATWEDVVTVPDFVFGAAPRHPAIETLLSMAIERLDIGPWASGPGVFTDLLPTRSDTLLLPPGCFAPYHYRQKHRRQEDHAVSPWCFGAHHWHGSWLNDQQRAELDASQIR